MQQLHNNYKYVEQSIANSLMKGIWIISHARTREISKLRVHGCHIAFV